MSKIKIFSVHIFLICVTYLGAWQGIDWSKNIIIFFLWIFLITSLANCFTEELKEKMIKKYQNKTQLPQWLSSI